MIEDEAEEAEEGEEEEDEEEEKENHSPSSVSLHSEALVDQFMQIRTLPGVESASEEDKVKHYGWAVGLKQSEELVNSMLVLAKNPISQCIHAHSLAQ